MNLIAREELKSKIDRGDEFLLIMTLGDWAFRAKHIPGSLNYSRIEDVDQLDPNADIVVYCSNPNCISSQAAYRYLEKHGFKNIRRYAGGLEDWEAAGYPLEGETIEG